MPKDDGPSPQPIILGFLFAGPAHPYGLYRQFDRELGRVWRIGQASLYARLKRAEEEGLVRVTVEEAEGAPDRRMHLITALGKKTFLAWLRAGSARVRDVRLEFLARLYFFRRLGLEGLEEAVSLQKKTLAARLGALEGDIAAAERSGDEYWRLVLEFRRSETNAVIDWLDTCLRR